MRILFVALALSFWFEAAPAATDAPVSSAPGVADMLQRRQESQLREQLAKEGRWEEIKQMDEEQLRRQQVQKKQTIARLNAELAREGTVDTATNGDGVYTICGPVRTPAKVKADSNGSDTGYVR